MTTTDPIDLLFGGMEKLGPGSDAETLRVLRQLPRRRFDRVVDAGAGSGRQTLVLARELATPVDAVELSQTFLDALMRRAAERNLERLVRPHCLDMKEIPQHFREIDLLWSEGAAYNSGFANALATWAPAVVAGGFAAVSELTWLKDDAPDAVREFFGACYPAMQSVRANVEAAENAGYRCLATHTLPREAWVDGYYDVLGPRARSLLDHPDAAVRAFAAETLREVEVFERSEESYGYVFYALQRA
jgi:SAM-dependent methyltransferase